MQPHLLFTMRMQDGALPPTQPPGLHGADLAGVPTLPDQVIVWSRYVTPPEDIEVLGAAAIAAAREEILRRRLAKMAPMIGQGRMLRGWDMAGEED